MKRSHAIWAGCLLALLALSPAGVAQGDDATQAARSLLEVAAQGEVEGLGVHRFGFHLPSGENVGQGVLAITRDGDGYRVEATARFQIGVEVKSESVVWLDETLAMKRETQKARVESLEQTLTEETIRQREGARWQETVIRSDATHARGAAYEGPNHGDLSSMLLLTPRMVTAGAPGRFALQRVDWPGGDEVRDPITVDVLVEVEAAQPYEHRGEPVVAHRVRWRDVGGTREETTLMVSAAGQVLSLQTSELPVRLIAGSPEEITRDLSDDATPALRASSAEEAVTIYLEVMAQLRSTDALDGVMDWEAMRVALEVDNPNIGLLTPPMIATFFKQGIEERLREKGDPAAEPPPGGFATFVAQLDRREEGGRVLLSRSDTPDRTFVVRQDGERWVIVDFPR